MHSRQIAVALIAIVAFGAQCQAFHETFSESWEERWIYSSTCVCVWGSPSQKSDVVFVW
jgi:hypothetical protein